VPQGPFTTADALRSGITRGQLRSRRWSAPFYGMRQERAITDTLLNRCLALATVLPAEAVFSGITAAALRGWWLPRGSDLLPLHVTLPPGRGLSRRGVRCTRSVLGSDDVVQHAGLRLTSGRRTLQDLAADWSLVDLTVLIDSALVAGACAQADLAALAGVQRVRGAATLRRAVALADGRSESPMETVMRLTIIVPGLPAPTPQVVIRDAHGLFVARVDLLGASGRDVFEYDGATHNEPRRHAADVLRWRRLRREGFEVYPYTSTDLAGGRQIIFDYQRSLGLPEDPAAVRAWLREWRCCSFARGR
jgi:hypothetical protein